MGVEPSPIAGLTRLWLVPILFSRAHGDLCEAPVFSCRASLLSLGSKVAPLSSAASLSVLFFSACEQLQSIAPADMPAL